MIGSVSNFQRTKINQRQSANSHGQLWNRGSVIQTLKEAQEKFIGQFQLLQNSVGKSFIVKDGNDVHEQSDKSTESTKFDTVTTEEAPQIPPSPPHSSSPAIHSNENFSVEPVTSKKVYSQNTISEKMVKELLSSTTKVGAYKKQRQDSGKEGVNELNICPIEDCKLDYKSKNLQYLKDHFISHFSKEIGEKYPFNSKSPQPCVICKKFTTRPTKRKTHNYHYGFVHRELLNIISDTDPRKEHILKFLN